MSILGTQYIASAVSVRSLCEIRAICVSANFPLLTVEAMYCVPTVKHDARLRGPKKTLSILIGTLRVFNLYSKE